MTTTCTNPNCLISLAPGATTCWLCGEDIGEVLVSANVSTVANVSPLRNMGRKARELFGKGIKDVTP